MLLRLFSFLTFCRLMNTIGFLFAILEGYAPPTLRSRSALAPLGLLLYLCRTIGDGSVRLPRSGMVVILLIT